MSRHVFTAIAVSILLAISAILLWRQLLPQSPVVVTVPESSGATRLERVMEASPSAPSGVAPGHANRPVIATQTRASVPSEGSHPARLTRKERRAEIQKASIGLAEELRLTAAEYEQLLDLMAEHSLQGSDYIASQLGSTFSAPSPPTDAQRSQIVALLGEDRAARYQHYLETLPIRTQVQQLRVELGESNTLTDSQATRLVEVFDEQRKRHMQDVKAQYAGMMIDFGMGMWYGATLMASGDRSPSRQDQLLTQIDAYNDRLVEAASTVLSHSQLEVFRWMQQDRMAVMRDRINAMREILDPKDGD
jgi:hypothetical protein